MKRLLVAACLLAACKGKSDKATSGSATASGSAPVVVVADAAPAPSTQYATAEAKLKRYQECLAAFNAHNTEVLAKCYSASSVREQVDSVPELVAEGPDRIMAMVEAQRASFPDLVVTPKIIVASGDTVAAVLHVGGKNSAAAGGMKATNKTLGVYEAEIVKIADDGTFVRDSFYVDQPTVYHQLGLLANDSSPAAIDKPTGEPEILISKGDATETANKALVQKLLDAVSDKDAKIIEAAADDDISFTYHGEKQKVESKKAYMKWMKDMLASTDEGAVDIKGSFAAGDVVVVADVFTGTPKNDDRAIRTNVIQFFRFADGKLKQHQMFANRLNTAVQLGIVDPDQLMQTLSAAAK
jgi:ketosteroid isomerase-like protein